MVITRKILCLSLALTVILCGPMLAKEFYHFPKTDTIESRDIFLARRPAAAGYSNSTGTRNITGAVLFKAVTGVAVSKKRMSNFSSSMQSALAQKAPLGGEVNFQSITIPDYGDINIGGSGGVAGTTISNSGIDAGFGYFDWIGSSASNRVSGGSLKTMLDHLFTVGNVHSLEAYQVPGLASVALSGEYNDLLNKPVLLRGYDGREVELQKTATHIQWRYVTDPPSAWNDLVPLTDISGADGADGADGKNYSCAITGGVHTLQYDKDGLNPAPTMTAYSVEMRENGVVVTPASYAWSTPAVSLLSGSSTAATFTPTVNGIFSPATDNRVDVAVSYAGVTCLATAPVPATKIGADGVAGSPDTKQQIYAKINAAVTGDVLDTSSGPGDANGFAFRTVRINGNIHRSDLVPGKTVIYSQAGDTADTIKLQVNKVSGSPAFTVSSGGTVVIY